MLWDDTSDIYGYNHHIIITQLDRQELKNRKEVAQLFFFFTPGDYFNVAPALSNCIYGSKFKCSDSGHPAINQQLLFLFTVDF